MIKKTLALLTLIPSLVLAQVDKKPDFIIGSMDTVCLDLKNLTELVDDAQEIPYVRGQSHPIMAEGPPLAMVIFVNPRLMVAPSVQTVAE